MANNRASSSNAPADNTGSNSHNESTSESHAANIIEATVGIGFWNQQEELPREQSLDDDFPTPGTNLSKCSDCDHERRPGGRQHYNYCLLLFVCPGNETSSSDNRPESPELEGKHC